MKFKTPVGPAEGSLLIIYILLSMHVIIDAFHVMVSVVPSMLRNLQFSHLQVTYFYWQKSPHYHLTPPAKSGPLAYNFPAPI